MPQYAINITTNNSGKDTQANAMISVVTSEKALVASTRAWRRKKTATATLI